MALKDKTTALWARLQQRFSMLTANLDDLFERYLGISKNQGYPDGADLISSADWAIVEQNPRRARLLVWFLLLIVLVLVLWAAIARIDEVTKGEGKVVPSRQIQQIQSLDGGIVQEIFVREGQTVAENQLLLKIDPTRFESSFNENQAEYLSLKAKVARLTAVVERKAFVLPEDVQKSAPEVAQQESLVYQSTVAEMEARSGVARQQLAQRSAELNEAQVKRQQAARNYELTARELEMTRPLATTGAVSDVELLRLERDATRARGERDTLGAEIIRLQAAIAEARQKVDEVEFTYRNQARTELAETLGKMNTRAQGSVALQDKVKRSEIRSPMKGTVKQLLVNTVGGVIQPGKNIIEIVPNEDTLVIETRILPKDVAFLRPGQDAVVKFTAYDFSTYGGMDATVENISADTVMDEKGNAFYIARVRTKARALGERGLPIIPGMVAEVDILTGKKSILAYLLKPVLRAKAAALTER